MYAWYVVGPTYRSDEDVEGQAGKRDVPEGRAGGTPGIIPLLGCIWPSFPERQAMSMLDTLFGSEYHLRYEYME